MQASDVSLVQQSRAGDRDAFAEIVRRYQSLLCSVAFGATGNLATSEEIAQEAFLSAWRSIGSLKDPGKLRAWLCGIVRNMANNRVRKRSSDILSNASGMEPLRFEDDGSTDPVESTIAREEVDLLNRTLSGMPANYREPLVLFYREQQSVSRVAELLDLSPSAVKQRLSRGREMLREEVAAVIERGLLKSAPGAAFTMGVLAALPVLSSSAKAATLTATTAKGISAMQAGGFLGALGIILGPLTGILGAIFGYRMSMSSARTKKEKQLVRAMTIWMTVLIAVFGVALSVLLIFGRDWMANNPNGLAISIAGVSIGYTIAILGTVIWSNRRLAQIRLEQADDGPMTKDDLKQLPRFVRQFQYPRIYESKTKFLGLPLVSVRFSGAGNHAKLTPAKGWIAVGDCAYGVIFAGGSLAVGGSRSERLGLASFRSAVLPSALWLLAAERLGGGPAAESRLRIRLMAALH